MTLKLAIAAAALLLSLIGLSVLLPHLFHLLNQLQQLMSDTREVLNALHNPPAVNKSIEKINRDLSKLQKWSEEALRLVKGLLPQQPPR